VPEGDTIFQTASLLRGLLEGKEVVAASARQPGPMMQKVVGSRVTGVESRGKHMLIRFSNGLTLHTHLRMTGSWHRYAPGERWRRAPSSARVVLEVPGSVVVCFNAPVVELMADRVVELHPALKSLGPDLLAEVFDADEAFRRLRDPPRAASSIAEALLDQRALAGIGNVFKSETLFVERVNPFVPVSSLDDATLRRILATAERLLRQNATSGQMHRPRTTTERGVPGSVYVYGRSGRPCPRCGTRIQSRRQGTDLPRVTYWCPTCQPPVQDP
jgi:endonuclease VIII